MCYCYVMALLFSENNFGFSHKDKTENMLIYDIKLYLVCYCYFTVFFLKKRKNIVTSGIYQSSSILLYLNAKMFIIV